MTELLTRLIRFGQPRPNEAVRGERAEQVAGAVQAGGARAGGDPPGWVFRAGRASGGDAPGDQRGGAGRASGGDAPGDQRGWRGRRASREEAMRQALGPVRAALLRRARDRADGIIADARLRADRELREARRAAAEQVQAAQRAGQDQAAALAAARRSDRRRHARSLVLVAQREAMDALSAAIRAAVSGLAAEPAYPGLRARLSDAARRLTGPGALIEEAPGGGVMAHAPGVLVDLSLLRLADAALEALGADVERLWAGGADAQDGEFAGPSQKPDRRAPGAGRNPR